MNDVGIDLGGFTLDVKEKIMRDAISQKDCAAMDLSFYIRYISHLNEY